MPVEIWHNPNCGTSRKVLETIRAARFQAQWTPVSRPESAPISSGARSDAKPEATFAERARVEPAIVDYVNAPPSVTEIKAVLKKAGLKARELLRKRGTPYDELGLDDPKLSDAELLAAMHRHPILIERPVVRTGKGTRPCRPPERVQDLL